MTDLEKAARQALEALDAITYRIERDLEHDHEWAVIERELASEAVTALRKVLEQPATDSDEFMLRGILAGELKCWHRLTEEEAQNLLAFVQNMPAAEPEKPAQQDTVAPGGGYVPAVPVAVYGYCPECGGAGVMRERRPNGDDKCTNGHKYKSSKALKQPAQPYPENFIEALKYDVARRDSERAELTDWQERAMVAEAVLAKLLDAQQEPVANIRTWHKDGELHAELWNWDRGIELLPDGEHDLYTRPQAREPLTDEQIEQIYTEETGSFIDDSPWALKDFVRAIEAAHGITGEKNG